MRANYYDEEDTMVLHLSEKPIVREAATLPQVIGAEAGLSQSDSSRVLELSVRTLQECHP